MKNVNTIFLRLLNSVGKMRYKYFYNNLGTSFLGSAYRFSRRRRNLILKHSHQFFELEEKGYSIIPNYLNQSECVIDVEFIKEKFEQ